MLNISHNNPAGGYLCCFKFANSSTQTIYVLLCRYLFEEKVILALPWGVRKLNACKKNTSYTVYLECPLGLTASKLINYRNIWKIFEDGFWNKTNNNKFLKILHVIKMSLCIRSDNLYPADVNWFITNPFPTWSRRWACFLCFLFMASSFSALDP